LRDFSHSFAFYRRARATARRPARSVVHGRYISVAGTFASARAPVVYIQYGYRAKAWVTDPRAIVTMTSVRDPSSCTERVPYHYG